MLAGLIQAPETFDPFATPDAAFARRQVVLGRMRELRSAAEPDLATAEAAPLGVVAKPTDARYPAGYFVERVKRFILDDERFGATPADRRRLLFEEGLRIRTTVDLRVQQAAEEARRPSSPTPPPTRRGPWWCSTPGPGSSGRWSADATSSALSRRPSSTWPPRGCARPDRRSSPSCWPRRWPRASRRRRSTRPRPRSPSPCPTGRSHGWSATTRAGRAAGEPGRRHRPLRQHGLRPAGPGGGAAKAIDMAHTLGISGPLKPYPSAVLGSNEVSVLDMASAYSTFAADGMHADPVFVTEITGSTGRSSTGGRRRCTGRSRPGSPGG